MPRGGKTGLFVVSSVQPMSAFRDKALADAAAKALGDGYSTYSLSILSKAERKKQIREEAMKSLTAEQIAALGVRKRTGGGRKKKTADSEPAQASS